MNYYKYVLLLGILLFSFGAFAQKGNIQLHLQQASLEELITVLETDYGYLFSYKESDIEGVFPALPQEAQRIDVFLNEVLKGTDLQFEIVEDNFVVLSTSKLTTERISFLKTEKEKTLPLLCGQIVDSLTQTPLSFANVYIKKTQKGISSNADGSFQLRSNFQAQDSLIISYVGYQEKAFLAADFHTQNCPTVSLNYLDFGEDFVVVTDYLTDGISLNNNGASTQLGPNKIGALPGQVEPDVLSTIQFLPGIISSDGAPANLSIRGGTPDQNLILWEDIPMYHAAHYFGMISAFNPYIIDKIDVYRGGFDTEYGGRIAGVIDLQSETTDKTQFGAGANFINAFAHGKVSFLDKKASLVFSARRSYTELGQTPTFKSLARRIQQGELIQNVKPGKLPPGVRINDDFHFLDTNLKLNYQLSDKDELSLAFFHGNNDFEATVNDDERLIEQADSLFSKNWGTSLVWNRQWSPQFSTQLLGFSTDSQYDYKYSVRTMQQNPPGKLGDKSNEITEQQVHLSGKYSTRQQHEWAFGYQLTNYAIAYTITKQSQQTNTVNESTDLESKLQVVHVAFNSDKENRMGVHTGLRWNYFQAEKQFYIEPRLRFWYRATDVLNIYVNAGRYVQFASQLLEIEGDQASIETPVWVLNGAKEVPVLDAQQFQIGTIFNKNTFVLDVQAFYKRMQGLTSLATDFDEEFEDNNRFHIGEAQVIGLDVLVKKRWGNYQSWMSYSLSQVQYHFPNFFDEDFIGPNDFPHAFHWVHLYQTGNWDFSLGWKLLSGAPYSIKENFTIRTIIGPPPPPGQMPLPPQEIIEPTIPELNTGRLLMRHQLDASATYTYQPKSASWKGVIGLSLYNIYDQKNDYNRSFFINRNGDGPNNLQYTTKVDLGFTPNIILRLEW